MEALNTPMPNKVKRAFDLYKQYRNMNIVADKIGVSSVTISNYSRKYNWVQLLKEMDTEELKKADPKENVESSELERLVRLTTYEVAIKTLDDAKKGRIRCNSIKELKCLVDIIKDFKNELAGEADKANNDDSIIIVKLDDGGDNK